MNSRRSGRFVQFAQFSPDGRLAVAATDQGRNMLVRLPKSPNRWKSPSQLHSPSSSNACDARPHPCRAPRRSRRPTMAAGRRHRRPLHVARGGEGDVCPFLHDGRQVVSPHGQQRQQDSGLGVAELPELTAPVLAQLKFVSPQVETGTGLVRVQAEFEKRPKARDRQAGGDDGLSRCVGPRQPK